MEDAAPPPPPGNKPPTDDNWGNGEVVEVMMVMAGATEATITSLVLCLCRLPRWAWRLSWPRFSQSSFESKARRR